MDFESFAEDEGLALLRAAYLLTGTKEKAEDLSQEALIHINRKWGKVRSADNPSAYARRILVNKFLSDSRSRRLSLVQLTESVLPSVDDQPAADMQDAFADRENVRGAIRNLPARQRTALVLRYYLQLTDSEVADAMGIRPATARSTIARALESMRAELVPEEETDDEHHQEQLDRFSRRDRGGVGAR